MRLSDILSPERIAINVEASSKKKAIMLLSDLCTQGTTANSHDVFDGLIARERLGSTGIGYGIAIPHARVPHTEETIGALMRLKDPIEFDAIDNKPVSLFFTLLVPESANDTHLQLLSHVAEMFSHEHVRFSLQSAASTVQLYQLILDYGSSL